MVIMVVPGVPGVRVEVGGRGGGRGGRNTGSYRSCSKDGFVSDRP